MDEPAACKLKLKGKKQGLTAPHTKRKIPNKYKEDSERSGFRTASQRAERCFVPHFALQRELYWSSLSNARRSPSLSAHYDRMERLSRRPYFGLTDRYRRDNLHTPELSHGPTRKLHLHNLVTEHPDIPVKANWTSPHHSLTCLVPSCHIRIWAPSHLKREELEVMMQFQSISTEWTRKEERKYLSVKLASEKWATCSTPTLSSLYAHFRAMGNRPAGSHGGSCCSRFFVCAMALADAVPPCQLVGPPHQTTVYHGEMRGSIISCSILEWSTLPSPHSLLNLFHPHHLFNLIRTPCSTCTFA